MRIRVSKLRLALSASVLAIAPGSAHAATCSWLTSAGNWATSGNWGCGAVPTAADDAVITGAGAVVSVSGITANAGKVTLGTGNALDIENSSTFFIYNNALTNDGTVTVSTNADLRSGSGIVTVAGSGAIVLDNSVGNARLFGGGWIFGAGQTVRGAGQLGVNQTIFTNNGLIAANVGGGNLSIDVSGGNGGVGAGNGFGTNGNAGLFNTGIIEATGGGTVSFDGGLYENAAGGIIRAAAGSVVSLNNDARILGGTLTSTGTGVINATGGNEYLTNVTLSSGSQLNVASSNTLYLNTAFTNNGTVTIDNTSDLRNEGGTLTIDGSGTIVLGATGSNRIFGGNIVFGSSQNVSGNGQLGVNQTTITNNAVFSVGAGGNLLIDASGGNGGTGPGNGLGTNANAALFNNSVIEATGGGTVSLGGGLYENASGGVIRAAAGSVVNLTNDARVLGGTLTSIGTGAIDATSGNEYLTNVTLSSGSHLNVASSNTLFLNTQFTNNGIVTIDNTSDLRNEGGTLTIDGSGTIVLGATGSNRIFGGNIVFGSSQNVSGNGQLGVNQTTITNNAVFSVGADGNLLIDASGGNGGTGPGNGLGTNANAGLFNNGIIEATGGGTLSIGGGLYENATGGIIRATTGSTVNLTNDARVLGGTLTSTGTGAINATSGNEYLTNVTLSSGSVLNVASSNTLYLNTLFTNNGTLTIDNTSDLRNESGTLTINGSGTIVLGATGSNRIFGGNIVFGSSQNVSGNGQLGVNQTTITNNAVFSVGAGGNLLIDASGGNGGTGPGNGVGTNANAGLFNNGVIEATGGGTVSLGGGLYENAATGIIRASAGSAINITNDARIVNGTLTSTGTGAINTTGGNEYLIDVTLSSGSQLNVAASNTLYLNDRFTNNGTLTIDSTSDLRNETGLLTIDGTGTIVLGATGSNRIFGGDITFGAGLTVQGNGQIGVNQTTFTNDGTVSAGAGSTIIIDATGGSGSAIGFLNNNLVQAVGGGVVRFDGGAYANGGVGLGGELFATAGSTIFFNSDANFRNLTTGGVLDSGRLYAQGYGGTGTIDLRSSAANSIVTIGAAGGNATEVILEGAGSVIQVTPFGGGTPVTIDQTLAGVAASGTFALHDRNFTVVANGGNFGNAGLTFVNNTVFTANGFTNSGQLISDNASTIVAPLTNSGLVHVASGTLGTQGITGPAGTITIDGGATLNLGGTSSADVLNQNGTLALGANTITITSDYTNANFGSGNAFAAHANVTGSGLILANSATMDLSGPALSGGTLNVGNVRTGGSSSTALTITNNGTTTALRGAVQNGAAPSVALSSPDFVLNPNGGSTTITISYTGLAAGSLAGQSLNVVNNFDNVADATIGLAGNIYQVAQAGAQPGALNLGARRVGDAAASSIFTVANVAPVTPGFNEALQANASVGSGFLLDGAGSATVNTLAAGSSSPITLSHLTSTAGSFSGTVSIANTSLAVAGSGLADLALAGQSIAVTSNVYAAAVANLSSNSVNFGTVREGSGILTSGIAITNAATGALTDSLVTSVGGLPAGITGSAPVALAAGQSGTASFSLDTSSAGVVSGGAALGFVSHDAELADLSLATQTVNFSGTITDLAEAALFKNAGAGTFGGSGTAYTFDLGSLSSDSGQFVTDFGVFNLTPLSNYAEALGGSFTQGAGTGYSFSGNTFSGLQGSGTNTGNLLTFDTTGLSNGTYTKTITFNGYSSYTGLGDYALAPIVLNISAQITGGAVGSVPEPSSWLMMILGFGVAGASLRRREAGRHRPITA